jgi:Flp pilus assembly protein TadD
MKPHTRQPRAETARPRREIHFFVQASIIFLVAATIRLLHIWQIRRAPFFTVLMGDARGYDDWARQIAAGDWVGKEVFYQAPLYPYFLGTIYAALGHSLLAVRLCQAIVGASASVLLGLAARRLFSARVGLIAGLGLALYAPAIFFDGLIQKSVLDVFFMCLSLWILSGLIERPDRALSWLGLGLAMGGLSLTRENALVLIVVIAAWGLTRLTPDVGKVFSSLGAFVLGLAIVLLPVAVRNYAVGGGFYLTTSQLGPNLYIGNNPRADGTYMSLRYGRGAPEYERQDATDLAERAMGRKLTPAEVSSYWTDRALGYVTSQPLAWLRLMGRKFVLLWNVTEAVDTESQETYAEWSTPLAIGAWIGNFGILMPLAVFGFWAAWPERKRVWVLYALTAAYAASVLIFYVFARYRFPLVPLLMLFAARGLVAIPGLARDMGGVRPEPGATKRLKKPRPDAAAGRGRRQKVAVLVAVAAAAVFANWPVLSAATMQAVTENNLAVALQAEGRLDEATTHYQRATALSPGYAPAYNNLATALRAKGDVDRAVATYERALAVQPDYPDAHYNLANALMDQDRADEAVAQFTIALRSIPGSVDVENNLGIALVAAGKANEGIVEFEKALAADPNSIPAHRNIADALTLVGRHDEAIAHLRRAAEISPRDASVHYDLGRTLLDLDRFSEAVSELGQAIALDPGMAEAHNDLGVALMRDAKIDDATAEFRQALKLKPDFTAAAGNLAAIERARHAQKPR